MKITTEMLKRLIKEEMGKLENESTDKLNITTSADGWKVEGMYKGYPVKIDSSYKKGDPQVSQWINAPRFAMARELTGYFYRTRGESGMTVKKQDLDATRVTLDGKQI